MSFENVVLTYPQPHIVVYVEDNTTYTGNILDKLFEKRYIFD